MKNRVRSALTEFPVVALVGARQCGKTTLARSLADRPSVRFFDLEDPRDQLILEDPMMVLRGGPDELIVIDEAQRMPELFPVLRVLVDEDRRPGRFLLLGSARPSLRRQSAESLAGRIMTLELTPFTVAEVVPAVAAAELLWLRGGLPPSLLADTDAQSMRWRRQYLRDITERDLRLIGFDLPPARMFRFLQMLAHNHGQLWNASQLARSLDIGASTAGRYLDAIQQTFLVRRLAPFFRNLGKRLIKSPKTYIRDSGLLHCLLGLPDRDRVLGHPVAGYAWEGFVAEQIAAMLRPGWELSFWRTVAGTEIDLLVLYAGEPRIAIEAKMSATKPRPGKGFYQGCKDLGLQERWVVYPGDSRLALADGVFAVSLSQAVERVAEIVGESS